MALNSRFGDNNLTTVWLDALWCENIHVI